jgi:hypothetical protein
MARLARDAGGAGARGGRDHLRRGGARDPVDRAVFGGTACEPSTKSPPDIPRPTVSKDASLARLPKSRLTSLYLSCPNNRMSKSGRKILAHHRRRGQRFIAPFNELDGIDVSWAVTIIPELVWIAVIQDWHGLSQGVELIRSLARAAREIRPGRLSSAFAAVSSFGVFSEAESERLRNTLEDRGELCSVREPLKALVSWYPECPLSCIFSGPGAASSTDGLDRLKSVVSWMSYRTEREAMMVQATVLRLMFDADAFKVHEGSVLSKFVEIERYPSTELSREVGSMIRATLNGLFGQDSLRLNSSTWPQYFWNRGLTITDCDFGDG